MLFFPERFPFDDPPKFGLVLVLFPVSAASVVVGTTWVTARVYVGPRTIWDNTATAQNLFARLIIRPPGFGLPECRSFRGANVTAGLEPAQALALQTAEQGRLGLAALDF